MLLDFVMCEGSECVDSNKGLVTSRSSSSSNLNSNDLLCPVINESLYSAVYEFIGQFGATAVDCPSSDPTNGSTRDHILALSNTNMMTLQADTYGRSMSYV
jgi:hypothetical protein